MGPGFGNPVPGFTIELVNESPATCPRSLTKYATASGPPKEPKSCIAPSCHRKARIWVTKNENGSGVVFVASPTTSPRLLTENAELSLPPSVPRSMASPSFQRTARTSGKPGTTGSSTPFRASPAVNPVSLIHLASLASPPGSTPKSVRTPFCHWNA